MAAIRTHFTELFDLRWPIVQAPIGSGARPPLATAVSNAGALGMVSVTWESLDRAREMIRETAAGTDRPFGVNLVIDPAAKQLSTEDQLAVCLSAGVEAISLSFGDAAPYVDRIHDAGAIAMQTVGSAAEARDAVEAGVDVVVAQGWEAGGHVQSDVASLPLVPRVADAVSDVPVIAAGGIADGRGIAAAIALGASGAWLGTRFVATAEAWLHERYKRRIAAAAETETLYSQLFDGGWPDQPHRVLRNVTTERWERAGRPPPGERPGEGEAVAELPGGTPVERYSDILPLPGMAGDLDALALYAGQSTGLLDEISPAADVVATLGLEAVEAMEDVAARVAD